MAAPGPDKKLCGAQRLNAPLGVTCRRAAGHGTDHLGTGRCSRHGGNTPSHRASARELQARAACEQLGIHVVVDPGEALLEEVYIAKGAVAFYGALVEQLAKRPVAPEYEEIHGGPQDGQRRLKPARGEDAVYMPTYHASGLPTGRAEPHVLVRLWMEERLRARDAAAAALKAGVKQRLLDLAEHDAQRIAQGMIRFAVETGQDPDSAEVRAAMRLALQAVAGNAAVVEGTAAELPAVG